MASLSEQINDKIVLQIFVIKSSITASYRHQAYGYPAPMILKLTAEAIDLSPSCCRSDQHTPCPVSGSDTLVFNYCHLSLSHSLLYDSVMVPFQSDHEAGLAPKSGKDSRPSCDPTWRVGFVRNK